MLGRTPFRVQPDSAVGQAKTQPKAGANLLNRFDDSFDRTRRAWDGRFQFPGTNVGQSPSFGPALLRKWITGDPKAVGIAGGDERVITQKTEHERRNRAGP